MRKKLINLAFGALATLALGLAGCGGGGGGGGTSATTPTVTNTAPVANAGTTQSVVTGTVVTLDGSASNDANGDSLTYSWIITSKPAGSSAVLSSSTAVKPTFTADVAGAFVLNLIVNDGKISSVTASVTVNATSSVINTAPVANAGTAQSVVTGTVVTLDGSGSNDANGDLLTYRWSFTSKPAGSSSALSSAAVAKPTFTPDVAGAYVLNLVVNDGKTNSVASTVTVTVLVPKITNIQVTGAFNSIMLQWDAVNYQLTENIEIWRSKTNDATTAIKVGTVNISYQMYSDTPPRSSGYSETFYYWVRIIDSTSTAGEFNLTQGTPGSTANDPAYVQCVLSAQITGGDVNACHW